MKGTSKPRLPHLRPAQPHLRVRGCFLSENAAMPPGQQVKVQSNLSNPGSVGPTGARMCESAHNSEYITEETDR